MDERKMNWRMRLTADAVLLVAALALLVWALTTGELRSILIAGVAVAFTLVYLFRDIFKRDRERREEP